jgi:hypothetical protein
MWSLKLRYSTLASVPTYSIAFKTIAPRPRRLRQTQTSVVPSEDDIHNDLGNYPDPIKPAEGELQSLEDESFPKIDQIEAYLQSIPDPALDSQSTTQSHTSTPMSSSSVPATGNCHSSLISALI